MVKLGEKRIGEGVVATLELQRYDDSTVAEIYDSLLMATEG
ncbi:MAG: hypothetical protein AAB373_03520 [Patescibacteria group bacterium]